MYRLIGDNHTLDGLPFAAQVFIRALDNVRSNLATRAGVTDTQLRALSRIAEESPLAVSALGGFLDVPRAQVQALIDGLVERGLVLRAADQGDPASTALELTVTGHALMEQVYRGFQDSINHAAETMDGEKRYVLDSALLRMARKLDAAD